MKVLKTLSILFTVFLFIVGMTACTNNVASSGDVPKTDPIAAASLVDDAIQALENGNFDEAHSNFSQAVLNDPTNGQALLGYALLEVMSITIDPAVVSLAKNNLGLVDYPSTINEFIDGTWGDTFIDPDQGDSYEDWFPTISGQTDDNNDGVISFQERGMAELEFFVAHNLGFNELVNGMSSVFEDRINSVLSVIDSIPNDTQIVFPGEATGIEDNDGNPQDLVVGKAEVNILAAYLLTFRSNVRMGQVYDYELPDLSGYYNSIISPLIDDDENTSLDFTGLQSPFSGTFLEPSTEAVAKLAAAKADMQSMIDRLTGAMNMIRSRTGSAFSISQDSTLVVGQDDEAPYDDILFSDIWTDVETEFDFADLLFTELDDSFDGGGMAYIPIPDTNYFDGPLEFMEYYTGIGNWPTVTNLETSPYYSVGIDYGAFYSSPLMAINVIFDLDTDGEPVFYKWDGAGGFTGASDVPDLDENDHFYYVKINDISFNGTISPSMIPTDDATTPAFRIDSDDFDYNDSNFDGDWDTGETIYEHGTHPDISGILDIGDWSGAPEPAEHYWPSDIDFSDSVNVPDSELDNITGDNTQREDLRTALDAVDSQGVRMDGPLSVLDGTAVYLAIPKEGNFAVWNSFTTSNVDTIVVDSTTYTSTGSFWWGLATMASMSD